MEHTVLSYLRTNPRFHSASMMSEALNIPWKDLSDILKDLSRNSDVLQSGGLFKYYEFNESNRDQILKIIEKEIDGLDVLDVTGSFTDHKQELNEIGIKSYLDLLAILEHYEPTSRTAIMTQLRTGPFRKKNISSSEQIDDTR